MNFNYTSFLFRHYHQREKYTDPALWRATGMKDSDFDEPIIVVANSISQFEPGHAHLKVLGQKSDASLF